MRKHTWKFYVAVAACILAAMHLINRIIAILSREQDFLFSYHGSFYPWRSGNVFYTRQGEGTPVLLIHNLDPAGSDLEYRSVLSALAQEHTVYTVDLPGCGRSDKPAISYTAYSYVQMIRDFIKEVVEEPVTLAASGNSAPFAILTAHSDPELVSDLVLINPAGLRTKCLQKAAGAAGHRHVSLLSFSQPLRAPAPAVQRVPQPEPPESPDAWRGI